MGVPRIHAPVCNHRRDEFVVGRKVVACIAGLIGVVEFAYVSGIVSVQHSGIAVFHTAQTIPFVFPLAEMLGVVPG